MEGKKIFIDYRKRIYASINGTKGNLIKLSKSKFLSNTEKEKLSKVIEAIEELRKEYYGNRGKKRDSIHPKVEENQ